MTDAGFVTIPGEFAIDVDRPRRKPEDHVLSIHGLDDELLVAIRYDGKAEFGPTYDEADAARRLWEAFGRFAIICPKCQDSP